MTGHCTTRKGNMKTFESNNTLQTSTSKGLGYTLSCLPSYDGFDYDKYINWEIQVDQIFAQCRLCDRKMIKIATNVLKEHALLWWNNLHDHNKPRTWLDMKILMRKQFNSSGYIVSSRVPNLLQDLPQQILSDQMVKAEQNECNDLFRLAFVVKESRFESLLMEGLAATLLVLTWLRSFA